MCIHVTRTHVYMCACAHTPGRRIQGFGKRVFYFHLMPVHIIVHS